MMTEPQLTRISKTRSYHLRHRPDALGLTLGPGGWVAVDTLLAALAQHGKPVTRAELDEVVARNPKQRFAFDETGARIRASQGHSVASKELREAAQPFAIRYYYSCIYLYKRGFRRTPP
jgi:putative RNA 2'-phosphotransferase